MGALFARSFTAPEAFDDLFACYGQLTEIPGQFDAWTAHATNFASLDDTDIIAVAARRLDIQPIDLPGAFDRQNFVFLKINHIQWEYCAWLGLSAASQPLIRPFKPPAGASFRTYHRSLFDDLLVLAMRRLETAPGHFNGPGHSLGLGLSNGDTTFADDVQPPLHPVVKNALTGLLAFFDGFAPGRTVHGSDPAAVKRIFFAGELRFLAQRAAESADRMVFIVPPHLARISLREPAPPQDTILVPGTYAHELWPAVMAGVIGQLTEILDRYRRVVVLMQAGAMSVPIGTMIHLLAGERPDGSVHCLDLGQLLDVAASPSRSAGQWIRRRYVAEAIAAQPIPFVLAEA
jgi:hypothetical protein